MTTWIDGIDKALVFTWDDANPGASKVAEVFDKHGLKTTFFLNTSLLVDYHYNFIAPMRRRNTFKEIASSGHEIGSHTYSHAVLTKRTIDDVELEMTKSSDQILEIFGYRPATMSHPTSKYNETIDSLMRLHYIDSRYSVVNDNDSLRRYMQVRTAYSFNYYKEQLDAYFSSNATSYVFGGHQADGEGYEPIRSSCLDSLLTYVQQKYGEVCWITTYGNVSLQKELHKNIEIQNNAGKVSLSFGEAEHYITDFPQLDAMITLCFPDENLDFASDGLVRYWYDGKDSYCTIDLRKSKELRYSVINKNVTLQEAMRGAN